MKRPPAETVIEVRDLTVRFGSQTVLDGLSLRVERGEVLGIVGGSGAGKSVLLRTIIGLIRPASGSVRLLGHDMLALDETERAALERRSVGVLFQDGALFSSLTVSENVQVPLREHLALPRRLMEEVALLKLGMVGLDAAAAAKYPSQLSGGMRKRAGLARALVLDPEILFLDEPTAGLDPIGAAAFDDLLSRLHKTLGLTVFFVTHDLDSLYTVCDRIAVLVEGKVLVVGTIEELLRVDHPWVVEYFHGPRARAAKATNLAFAHNARGEEQGTQA